MNATALTSAINCRDMTLYLDGATGVSEGKYLLIGDELMVVRSVSGTYLSVRRGMASTPVTDHRPGAVVLVGNSSELVETVKRRKTGPIDVAHYVPASIASHSFLIAPCSYQVVKVTEVHSAKATDSGEVGVELYKDGAEEAVGAGDAVTGAIDLKADPDKVQCGEIIPVNSVLAEGDRLSLKFSGTPTDLDGVVVTVTLNPV